MACKFLCVMQQTVMFVSEEGSNREEVDGGRSEKQGEKREDRNK